MKSRIVPPMLLLVCGVLPATVRADPFLNLATTFDPIKAKLAGGGTGRIVVIGDSLSFRPGSWLYPFESAMQSAFGDAGAGYQGFSLWTGAGFDPGWTYNSINADAPPYHALDGLWASTAAATDASFMPNNSTYQLQYVAQPGGGSFQQFYWGASGRINVGSPISTAAATSSIQTLNLSTSALPAGSTPWFATDGSGPVLVLGANNSSGKPGLVINRAANGGWGVNDFLQRDWTFDAQLKLLNPDLYFVWLGQNDQAFATANDYAGAIAQLVGRLRSDNPAAKVCLVGTYNSGGTQVAQLAQGMNQVAAAQGLGFINLYQDAGSYAFFTSSGYLQDGVHFSTAGGQYMGQLMYSAFQTDGASLFDPGDANHDGMVNLADLLSLARHYGTAGGGWEDGDFNGDGTVNFADLLILARHYGQGPLASGRAAATPALPAAPGIQAAPSFAQTPDPSVAPLTSAAAAAILIRRRGARRTLEPEPCPVR